jgi:hypothetical protein
MSSIVTGQNMIMEGLIDADWFPLGCATNCAFQFSNELIGKTDVNAGLFRKYRVRLSDCTADIQGLASLVTDTTISAFYFLQEAIRRTEVDLRFRFIDEVGNTQAITGKWLVSTVGLTADVSAFTEFDIAFQGTGGVTLAPVVIDSPGEGAICEVQETIQLTLGAGSYSVSSGLLIGADREIIFVDREGTGQTAAAGPRHYAFNSATGTITFDVEGNPGGEGIEIGWLIVS